MANITVLGASGFAGAHVVQEATARDHRVTAVSRSGAPEEGTCNIRGSVLDGAVLDEALSGADVVVGSLSPRGDMAGRVVDAYRNVAQRLNGTDTRFIVIGGFGSLKTPESERIANTDDFPEAYRPEARELLEVLLALETFDELDWTYVSPAANFGSYIPNQERLGRYRASDETPLFDEQGESAISGADLAVAVLDTIESGDHRRSHVSFVY